MYPAAGDTSLSRCARRPSNTLFLKFIHGSSISIIQKRNLTSGNGGRANIVDTGHAHPAASIRPDKTFYLPHTVPSSAESSWDRLIASYDDPCPVSLIAKQLAPADTMTDTMASTRMMHMYMDGWAKHKILDSDKKTVLYRTHRHLRMSKSNSTPEIEVFRADPTAPKEPSKDIRVDTASRRRAHKIDKTIDMEIGDHKLEFQLESPKQAASTVTRVYQSLRLKTGQVTWEAFGKMKDTAQMSEEGISGNDVVLAKLERLMWSWKKFARMALYRDGSQEMMDEIAVTAAAMWLSLESADGQEVSSVYGTTTARAGAAAAQSGVGVGGGGGAS